MKRRNLILIMALSLSLTFAAGCGEDQNTGAAGNTDQQETSETAAQDEPQTSEDSGQDKTEAADAKGDQTETEQETETEETESEQETETEQEAQTAYQVEMVSYKKTDLVDISYPKITGWSNTEKQDEWNTIFENAAKEAAGEKTDDTEGAGTLGANDAVTMKFTIQEQNGDILSLTSESYYDYEGAAHPSAALTSYNINMKTGEKMTLSDLADPGETAKILFAGKEEGAAAQGFTVLDAEGNPDTEITMKDILEYNFIWMEPTEEALAASLAHFDGDVDDYGTDETMGESYVHDGNVYVIFYVSHAMGDYAVVRLDETKLD